MNKKILVLIIMVFCTCIFKGSTYSGESKNRKDIIQVILSKSKCNIEESGVRACYDSDKVPETECLAILKRLSFSKGCNINVDINNDMYCVSFKDEKVDGYIESMKGEKHREVIINISLKDVNNNIDRLHKEINYAIGKNEQSLRFFDYVKGKISEKDTEALRKSIEIEVKTMGVNNLKTYKVDNGTTTQGYCGSYPALYVDGEYVDINYSIATYSSGDYIIIGTPILMTTY